MEHVYTNISVGKATINCIIERNQSKKKKNARNSGHDVSCTRHMKLHMWRMQSSWEVSRKLMDLEELNLFYRLI